MLADEFIGRELFEGLEPATETRFFHLATILGFMP